MLWEKGIWNLGWLRDDEPNRLIEIMMSEDMPLFDAFNHVFL